MKYISEPFIVDAIEITRVLPMQPDGTKTVELSDGRDALIGVGILPSVGDYYVLYDVNAEAAVIPKAAFEAKFKPMDGDPVPEQGSDGGAQEGPQLTLTASDDDQACEWRLHLPPRQHSL